MTAALRATDYTAIELMPLVETRIRALIGAGSSRGPARPPMPGCCYTCCC
jgi:hypothetical protein